MLQPMDGNCSKETFLLFNTLDIAPLRSSPFGLVPEPGEESSNLPLYASL